MYGVDVLVTFEQSNPLDPEKSHQARVTQAFSTRRRRATKNHTSKSPATLPHRKSKTTNTDTAL